MLGGSFILLWWLAEWFGYRQEDRVPPSVRDPLRLLVLATRRLWKNRSFLWALLGLWVATTPLSYLQRMRWFVSAYGHAPDPRQMASGLPRILSEPRTVLTEAPRLLVQQLPRALPDKTDMPLGHYGIAIVAAALAVTLIWLLRAKPSWIPSQVCARLFWPLQFTLAGCVLRVVQGVLGDVPGPSSYGPGVSFPWLRCLYPALDVLLAGVLLAPASALMWHIGLQIARGDRWNLRDAIRAMAMSWPSIALLEVVAYTPTALALSLSFQWSYGVSAYLTPLARILGVVLALCPWIIVDQQVGLGTALRETYRLVRGRAFDLLTFGLRFVLLFAVAEVVFTALRPPGAIMANLFVEFLSVPHYLLMLAKALVIATLYLQLRREAASVEGASSQTPMPLEQ